MRILNFITQYKTLLRIGERFLYSRDKALKHYIKFSKGLDIEVYGFLLFAVLILSFGITTELLLFLLKLQILNCILVSLLIAVIAIHLLRDIFFKEGHHTRVIMNELAPVIYLRYRIGQRLNEDIIDILREFARFEDRAIRKYFESILKQVLRGSLPENAIIDHLKYCPSEDMKRVLTLIVSENHRSSVETLEVEKIIEFSTFKFEIMYLLKSLESRLTILLVCSSFFPILFSICLLLYPDLVFLFLSMYFLGFFWS